MTSNPGPNGPTSICVVRLSAIGDCCHALAVVRNLQDNWPQTQVTWVIGKVEASLLGDIPGIEFIIFDKSKGREAYRNFKQRMRGRQFDVALCMHASMRANRLYRAISAPRKIGFDFRRARDAQWLFTNERIAAIPREHALDAMMGFARHIGAVPKPLRWDIPLSADDQSFASQFYRRPTLAISPLSSQRSRNFRNWPVERFAAIADYAVTQHNCHVILTGGPTEHEKVYGDAIVDAMQEQATNLIGTTSLKQSLAVFAAADLVLCPDSGPAHMANAVGTPVIGLYASSNPDRTGPYISRKLIVSRYADALATFMNKRVDAVRWGQRVRDPGAMDLITVDEVTQMLDQALGEPL